MQEELKWYPIKVRGTQEEKTKQRIETAIQENNLDQLLKNIFVPYQRFYVIRDGKKIIRKRHFGYIVMQADLENKALCQLITNIAGVHGFISPEGIGPQYTPSPLSQKEVDNMLGVQVSQDQINDQLKQAFRVSEKVEIIDGVLKGKTAIIRKVDTQRKKIQATIQIFGKETKTEIAYAQVKKI